MSAPLRRTVGRYQFLSKLVFENISSSQKNFSTVLLIKWAELLSLICNRLIYVNVCEEKADNIC
jgi:hypothetical protein